GWSEEKAGAIPSGSGDEGRQESDLKSARGRHESAVRGRDPSLWRRQPNPATSPDAKAQHNAKNVPSAESVRGQSEGRRGTRSKQGIANRSAEEEGRRQGRVVSIRDDAKAGSRKRASSRKTG